MSLMFCMSSTAFVEPSTIQEYFANVSVDKIVGPAHQTVRSAAREYVHAKQLALNNFHIEAIKHYRNAATLDVLSPAPWIVDGSTNAVLDMQNIRDIATQRPITSS
jgi:hypothetical protein